MTTPYYQDDLMTLHHGDCLDVLRTLPDCSVDSVVTDPPYGLRFMGKSWDGADIEAATATRRGQAAMPDDGRSGANGGYRSASTEAGRYDLSANAAFGLWCEEWAAECLRVLKPGGHLLAFGGSRTWHRLATGIEDAGFEIRDSIAWLYGSGFPKSMNVAKAIATGGGRPEDIRRAAEWGGWGTALKPAFEPIVVGRKPLVGTVAANVLAHGTGALNIDACRLPVDPGDPINTVIWTSRPSQIRPGTHGFVTSNTDGKRSAPRPDGLGRWPANVILDESQAAVLDQQSGELTSGSRKPGTYVGLGYMGSESADFPGIDGDSGGASRFFLRYASDDGDWEIAQRFYYAAKAGSSERVRVDGVAHPTVKPLELMRWLIRLVTPPGGLVLEPFAGSGTTVEACLLEGMRCIAIEREADYLPLIRQRIDRRRDPVAAVRGAGEDGGLFDLLEEGA